jgi:flagellar biosynthesis protein FlhB
MSEEKRFEATAQRRDKAMRDGNVARSVELGGIVAFGAATLALCAALPLVVASALDAVRSASADPGLAAAAPALALLALGALVPAVGAALGAVVAGLAQAGGLRMRGVKLDLAKLAPGAGLKRMFGADALVGLARAAIALLVALGAMLPLARDVLGAAAAIASPSAGAMLVRDAALRACLVALAAGGAFALADYALAKRRWLASLRMSFDELKRESKENEGDPHAKARRKHLHRSLLRGAIARTREASFVVVNPTHVAVALKYAPPVVPVPEILVRAAGDAALRVKTLAREHAIPIVENVPLARLLFAAGEPGRAIPPDTFVAVAQIIASLTREGVLS